MTLATLAASQPAGQRLVRVLETRAAIVPGTSLCYTEDVPVTVQVIGAGGLEPLLHSITGLGAGAPAPREDGGVSVDVRVPDDDGALWRRIRANIGGQFPITVVLREYSADDLAQALTVRLLELASPQRSPDALSVSFAAVGTDLVNRDAGQTRFTEANAPGLRGR